MIWIIQSDKSNVLKLIENNIAYYNGKIDYQDISIKKGDKDFMFYENKTLSLFYFLYRIPEVYEMLSKDNQTEIKSIAKKNINLQLMTPYLYESSSAHIKELKKEIIGLNNCINPYFANDLFKQAYNKFDYSYNDFVIYYFYHCQNSSMWSPDWDYINLTYKEMVSKSIPFFTQKQVEYFLSELTMFYTQATCFKNIAMQIIKVSKEKGYDIDFSNYNIDVTKYAEV